MLRVYSINAVFFFLNFITQTLIFRQTHGAIPDLPIRTAVSFFYFTIHIALRITALANTLPNGRKHFGAGGNLLKLPLRRFAWNSNSWQHRNCLRDASRRCRTRCWCCDFCIFSTPSCKHDGEREKITAS